LTETLTIQRARPMKKATHSSPTLTVRLTPQLMPCAGRTMNM
jgi:hypothetical protein